MDIYLVGGAIRDELLDLPVTERDWVVVHGSPEELLALGYKPVGNDFPVFLHPQTGEEYALARTERKSGHGHAGFEFHAAPEVTLEQDLLRRDLTINAIARHPDGALVDPYHGLRDLKAGLLRHVSGAFAEDPLRVLRVARFAARYHHLGFRVADETLALMTQMAASGELRHLTPERVWKELSRALMSPSPSCFLATLHRCGALAEVLPEVARLDGIASPDEPASSDNLLTHLYRSLAQAEQQKRPLATRYALLCHDLGRANPAPPERHRQNQHDETPVRAFSDRLRVPREVRDTAIAMARTQTPLRDCLQLTPAALLDSLRTLDALRRPQRLQNVLAAVEACVQAKHGNPPLPFPQADYLMRATEVIRQIGTTDLQQQGLRGAALGQALSDKRRRALEQYRTEFIHQWQTTHNGPLP